MKILIFTTLIFLSVNLTNAQINAITDTGDEVILFDDNTWEYVDIDFEEKSEIPINNKEFLKDEKSKFLVKSKRVDFGVWMNPKIWSFKKGTESDEYEFLFQKKSGDLYAILISEKLQIPVETLKEVAVENAKSVATNVKILKEEYRTVNGKQLLMIQMSANIQGLKLIYYGYYYSDSSGTVQLLAYTGENLFDESKDEIELFLNGFIEL